MASAADLLSPAAQPLSASVARAALLQAALDSRPGIWPPAYLDHAVPIAFEEILVPFVEAARARLARACGPATPFAPAAQRTIERHLLAHLSGLALRTLASEFALYRGLHGPQAWAITTSSAGVYRRFVTRMQGGGLRELLRVYPGLAWLLAGWCCDWVASHHALAGRLEADWRTIRRRFAFAPGACGIDAIAPGLSDPHDGGAQVSALTLPGGDTLIYKPRDLAMEKGLGTLLAWAGHRGFSKPYRRMILLTRQTHGWMEMAAPRDCASSADISAFYHRVGGLLCLVSLLQGTDIHRENLIAAGDQPVIVDAETLLHPHLDRQTVDALGIGAARAGDDDDLLRCLAETGLLPIAGRLDFAALGSAKPIETPFAVPQAACVNADALTLAGRRFTAPAQHNLPTLAGVAQPVGSYADAVLGGFAEMFGLALEHKASLLAALDRFAGRRTRVILRGSNVYGLLLQTSTDPSVLRDAAARRAMFEPLLKEERAALEATTVPRFTARCDTTAALWAAPLAEARTRIHGLAPTDLPRCLDWLRDALAEAPPSTERLP